MIRRSAIVAGLAGLLSLLLHYLGISFLGPGLPELRSEGDSVSLLELGNSFEDFTEATTDPVQPEPAEAPEPPAEDLTEPERAEIPISETLVASPDPKRVSSPDIGAPVAPQTDVQEEAPTEPVTASEAEVVENEDRSVTPLSSPQLDQLAALPPADSPAGPVTPLEDSTVDPEILNTVVEPSSEVSDGASEQAVVVSKRPRLPSQRPAAEPQNTLDGFRNFDNLRNPEQVVESPLNLYNREGLDPFRTSNSRNQSTGRGVGNSNTTNYAGQVLIHLNQTPVVYVSVRGFAQVFFEINPDGSLAWVDIVDSSGSPEIERAAKDQVFRAAPFPRPPSGSSRKLSFYYQNG
ncbi:cell envelope integrity protein TolA [uncultured Ruegeria sp.]|uniref:cell envelope integrity protein TolA n=1 Tax=uncultured Ruegeria sp. TaxID=259304 RepID=UPI00260F5323|nr:TonB family protein [uncultured Ruegeria sp.]